jgi:MFS family permease
VNRNVRVVLAVAVFFGAATGIYEFVLPYYLKERGLSFESMGAIFGISAAGMLALRLVTGKLADRWGRKLFYSLSLGGTALAMGFTPLSASVWGQATLKTLREAMFLTRDTLHPVILYEESRGRFMDFMGKTRGFEFLFQGGGTIICGLTLAALKPAGNLALAAGITLLGFIAFWLLFRETWRPHQRLSRGGPRELLSFHLHHNLKIITISVFIFNIGLTTSHCFIMPLFFSEKFGVSARTVAWVMVGHRLTIALPLLLAGTLAVRRLKGVYIIALAVEGVIQATAAVIPSFAGAGAVWLLHDLLGAGVWIPIQNLIIQEYTRPESRALELGKVLAFGGVGTILGPLLAGFLSQRVSVSAPFCFSGVGMTASAIPLLWLRLGAGLGGEEADLHAHPRLPATEVE